MLAQNDILKLFDQLNQELAVLAIKGELYVVGGAVMCLVFKARPSTHNVDAYFEPAKKMREAAHRVALRMDAPQDWLNDGVKAYLSRHGSFHSFLELTHLKIFTANADYLLAMKCLAMRIGEEFHDLDDVRYLLKYLNIETYKKALETISQFYPAEAFPQKTLYVLEELLRV